MQVLRLRSPLHPNDEDLSSGTPVRRPSLRMTAVFWCEFWIQDAIWILREPNPPAGV
jgi:hypothetical protein